MEVEGNVQDGDEDEDVLDIVDAFVDSTVVSNLSIHSSIAIYPSTCYFYIFDSIIVSPFGHRCKHTVEDFDHSSNFVSGYEDHDQEPYSYLQIERLNDSNFIICP